MVITYYGFSCFKIQSGDTTLVFDLPARSASGPSKKSGPKPRFHADIILQSQNYDGDKTGENSFLIESPGEYEIKGVYIRGLKSYHDSVFGPPAERAGKKYGLNTVYSVRFENINLCFLGYFGEKELRPELKEQIGRVDILFVPIGGNDVMEPEVSRNIINQIEPAIAIPMHYPPAGQAGALKDFLREMGQKDARPQEKLSIRKKDIDENGTKIVILSQI